jgi:hypothetical protein
VYIFGIVNATAQETPQVEEHVDELNPKLLQASGQFWAQIEMQFKAIGKEAQVTLQFGNAIPEKKYLQKINSQKQTLMLM